MVLTGATILEEYMIYPYTNESNFCGVSIKAFFIGKFVNVLFSNVLFSNVP